ncbi:MAG: 2-amino-4-hydroxy-6-hydroxymethyldihydropteridine diphosphokinase [Thermodesulfobacteriota bacterium]
MAIVFIGIGSNLGDRHGNCQVAIERLEQTGIKVLKQSSFYETEPHGPRGQPWFVNCVVKVETQLTPLGLLTILQMIENEFGRKRNEKWVARPLDLDILFYNSLVMENERITLPHPLSHLRGFVLIPLTEIDPDLIHPILKKTITELTENLKDGKKVDPIVSIR